MLRNIGLVLWAATLLAAISAGAEPASVVAQGSVTDLRSELDALRGRIAQLEDQAAKTPAKPLAGALNRRFMLVSEDGDYSMRLTARVHFKGQFPLTGPTDVNNNEYLELRRIRTGFEGKLAKYYEYKIEYDFGRSSAALTDGYLGLTHFGAASFRMGRYKVPFSVEELTSSNSIRFVERSMLNRFAPSRQIGASMHGKSGDFGYMAGAFNGAVSSKYLLAGRATLNVDAVTFGVNALTESNRGAVLPLDFRTDFGTRWFRYHADARSGGSRTQYGGDVSYWGGPLGVVAEYLIGEQDVALSGTNKSLSHAGWYVQASYVLTGEKATVAGVNPAKDFDPSAGGAGAFELVARFAKIDADDDGLDFATSASVKSASAVTAGVNWYMSRHTKLVLNYVHTSFDSEFEGEKSEGGILARVQLNY